MFSSRIEEKERAAMGLIRRISLVGVAVATMIVAVPRPASAASQIPLVPFHATISEVVGEQPFCPPNQVRFLCVELSGTGQATHLGRVTESAEPRVDFWSVNPVSGCADEVRTSTLTAHNGDQITLQGPGLECPITVTDSWVVISGTGRFAGATGYGTNSVTDFVYDAAGVPLTAVTTFSGMISSPGSNP